MRALGWMWTELGVLGRRHFVTTLAPLSVERKTGPRARHGRREPTEEGQRVQVDGDSAVRERLLQCDGHEPVGSARDSLLRDRGSQDVLEEGLASGVIHRSGGAWPRAA